METSEAAYSYFCGAARTLPLLRDKTLRDRARKFTEIREGFIRYMDETISAESDRLTCGPDCAYCCDHIITIDVSEVVHILLFLAEEPERKKQFLDNLPAWETKFEPYEEDYARAVHEDDMKTIEQVEGAFRVMCPMQHEGLCLIYPVRPVICRLWCSSKPPELCRANSKKNRHSLICTEDIVIKYIMSARHFRSCFNIPDPGLPYICAIMPHAVRNFLDNPVGLILFAKKNIRKLRHFSQNTNSGCLSETENPC